MTTLEYYFEDGSHVIFDKYTIDTSGKDRIWPRMEEDIVSCKLSLSIRGVLILTNII